MRIDRREALALLGLGAATPAAAQTAKPLGVTFQHGVASGDPTQTRVVLWTRITPESPHAQIAYTWALNPVDRRAGGAKKGAGVTGPDRDFTVKVDVGGLDAGRAYTFAFTAEGVTSPTGLTRTLPQGPTRDAVIATTSCALFPNGYFNAYQAIADLPRVDLVLALGDYIYEYGGEGSYGMDSPVAKVRPHDPPHEILTLADYRRRHAQYKTDPSLQAAHARAPWIVAWDDHETCNDSYSTGGQNHNPEKGEGDWDARKAAALKAYYEWMPIREPADGQTLAEASERSFRIGDLAQIVMLETRLTARGKQLDYDADVTLVDGKPDIAAFRSKLADPARRMMSPGQEAWLGEQLAGSAAAGHAWQVVGSGVVMGRLTMPDPETFPPGALDSLGEAGRKRVMAWSPLAKAGLPWGLDMWDGYPADRERVYEIVRKAGARPVVVTGDSHAFWANELSDAQGRRVAVEFGTTGVTSPGAGDILTGFDVGPAFTEASREVVFNDQKAKGFVLLTLGHDRLKAELMAVSTIHSKTFTTSVLKTFEAYPDGKGVSALKEV
ncbi:alkaline phosphatase D family protein [Phenylobacterium sp.]|uniref:alkaline phosphatase D family protein n=1 Tax=Phenylobacterium sp. TaxID=1871053 RepID=UPI0025E2653C|nr:alkaline phosphatase D family protein [Phenylobacterium sp.]MBX3482683.1 alkaline phosphatase D family protein [Phenylobacterium sp.]